MPSMASMQMSCGLPQGAPCFHESSGTGWQPASVEGPMWMTSRSGWDLMAHGTVFVTFNNQGGPRGVGKAESVNYLMAMEQHKLGRGTLLFRQMFSAESLTSPHPGFPELFQTGETYHGQPLVDHQHPHNVFAELAALGRCGRKRDRALARLPTNAVGAGARSFAGPGAIRAAPIGRRVATRSGERLPAARARRAESACPRRATRSRA